MIEITALQIEEALEMLRWSRYYPIQQLDKQVLLETAIIIIAWWHELAQGSSEQDEARRLARAEFEMEFWSVILGTPLKELALIRKVKPLIVGTFLDKKEGWPAHIEWACERLIDNISAIEYKEMML